MRRLPKKSQGSEPGEVAESPRRPDKRRVEELKRRCSDDFQRLKVSVEQLALEAGAMETVSFGYTMWLLDKIGLKSPW